MTEPNHPIAYSMNDAPAVVGIGRTSLFSEAKAGRLRTTKVGRRTVVMHDDLVAWLEAHRAAGDDAA